MADCNDHTSQPAPRLDDAQRSTTRHALSDAAAARLAAAMEPCEACETHPALLCPAHAAELDWVALYCDVSGALA